MSLKAVPLAIGLLIMTIANAQTSSLPDLVINREEITCENVDRLIPIAESDLARVKESQAKIPEEIEFLQGIKDIVKGICQTLSSITPITSTQSSTPTSGGSFLGTQSSSRVNKARTQSKSMAVQEKVDDYLLSKIDMKNDIGAKQFKKVSEMLSQLTTGTSNPTVVCGQIDTAIQDLINYLKISSNEIQVNYIDFLTNRQQELQIKKSECSVKPTITQFTGSREFIASELGELGQPGTTVRTMTHPIHFNGEFKNVPKISYSLGGVDSVGVTGVEVGVESVTTSGFQARITANVDAQINLVKILYVAFEDTENRYTIFDDNVDYDRNKTEFQVNTEGGGYVFVKHEFLVPKLGPQKRIVPMVTGVTLFADSPNFHIYIHEQFETENDKEVIVAIRFFAYKKTKLKKLSVRVLVFEQDDNRKASTTDTRFTHLSGDNSIVKETFISNPTSYSGAPQTVIFGLIEINTPYVNNFALTIDSYIQNDKYAGLGYWYYDVTVKYRGSNDLRQIKFITSSFHTSTPQAI